MNYVQQFDHEPQFWQFLSGLEFDDLIIELIQNDLDANATNTSITFLPDRLVCKGNGESVSDDGWRRLAYVMGAGDQVESKRFRIGVKNHGLKACFGLGDEIILRSDGRRTVQTLYKDGPDSPPSPGTLPAPEPDEEAPNIGCVVEIPYRRNVLEVEKGEHFQLEPTDVSSVEKIFIDACRELPERLMGAIRPGVRDQYAISLEHFRLGSVELDWHARRPRRAGGGGRRQFTLFSRECRIASGVTNLPSEVVRERASIFKIPFPPESRQEIPEFFTVDSRHFAVEVAWRIDKSGRPIASTGTRRYPIGYSPTSMSARTNVGVHFSGPYASDAERHGISQTSKLNEFIDNACRDALVEVMASHLVQRHGGKAMELYIDDQSSTDDGNLKDLVIRTIDKRAIPLQPRETRSSRRSKLVSPNSSRRLSRRIPLGPRRSTENGMHRVVLPMFTWSGDQISPTLLAICPASEDTIDRSVPSQIVRFMKTEYGHTVTFDEKDAIQRFQPETDTGYFPWDREADWRKALGDVSVAKKYLDMVYETIQQGRLDSEEEIVENAYLPDEHSRPRPFRTMHNAVNLPPNLPAHESVPILHRKLQTHPLLKRRAWKSKPFKIDDYIEMARLEEASVEHRQTFWNWLRNNGKRINASQLRKIKALPVWPREDGSLLPFDDLCRPQNRRIESILRDDIQMPSSQIIRPGLVQRRGKSRLRFRKEFRHEEVESFLSRRLSAFPVECPLTSEERREFHIFESDLAALSKIPSIKKTLSDLSDEHAVALSKDGTLNPPSELIRNDGVHSKLHLPARHIIDRPLKALDGIHGWAPRETPTSAQVLDSLREDGARHDAHIPRLKALVDRGVQHDVVCNLPCIPFNGKLFAPSELALRGRQDYWGDWKIVIPAPSTNAEVQDLYQEVGVVGGRPTPSQSREFFHWLSTQGPAVKSKHIDQILRHIGHGNGPPQWSDTFPNIPFIPAEGSDGAIHLFTKFGAIKGRGRVVIPDSESIAEAIRDKEDKWPVELAVVMSAKVTEPITAILRNMGLKTLSERAGKPERVAGSGINGAASDFDFETILSNLLSRKMAQQLKKRLDKLDLGANREKLKSRWRDSLSGIKDVKTAESVIATYRLSRHRYDVSVEGELDRTSGTLWVRSNSDPEGTFFDVLAENIFEHPQKYHGPALERAYWLDIREYYPIEYATEDLLSYEDFEVIDQHDETEDLTATEGRHPSPDTNPLNNLPDPGQIPEQHSSAKGGGRATNRSRSTRAHSLIENEQIDNLKKNQYAWHCQVCLSEAEPNVLAPTSSYVEGDHNRRRMIEAQHCDHVNARGARHAGNIILMCKFHHDELGDAFGRTEVIRSFKGSKDHSLAFSADGGMQRDVRGKIVTISPPQREDPISIFFTTQHFEYWLKKASEERIT